jgi:hypothetical protein
LNNRGWLKSIVANHLSWKIHSNSPSITHSFFFVGHETDSYVGAVDLTLSGAPESSHAVEVVVTCTGNVDAEPYEVTLNWDNGEQSVVDITSTDTTKLANGTTQVERTGTVLSRSGLVIMSAPATPISDQLSFPPTALHQGRCKISMPAPTLRPAHAPVALNSTGRTST